LSEEDERMMTSDVQESRLVDAIKVKAEKDKSGKR
jgi:hypothetical protein